MKLINTRLPMQLQYILGVYFLALFFMMLYRLAIFTIHCFISFSDLNGILLIKSLLYGICFDTIVLCKILAVFLILMIIATIVHSSKKNIVNDNAGLKTSNKWFYRPLHIILCFVLCIVFLVVAIDIAYFSYFQTHINIIALSWVQSPSYLGALILRHPIYLVYFSVFLFSLLWFVWLMYCLYNATLFKITVSLVKQQTMGKVIFASLVALLLCFTPIAFSYHSQSRLAAGQTYFSDSDFFNQLSVNPIFNLQNSIEEERNTSASILTVLDGKITRDIIQEQFVLQNDLSEINSAHNSFPRFAPGTNIVMIMLKDIANKDITAKQMPYLYSLSNQSLSFTSVYADGENDYNGIFSTLESYHNILSANSMNVAVIPKFNSLPTYLKHKEYRNVFFMNDKDLKKDISRFLYRNSFDEVITNKKDDVKAEIDILSNISSNFFACFLINNMDGQSIAKQTDRYIKNIIKTARQTSWFSKTAFVVVGLNAKDEIPFIIYYPNQIKRMRNNNLACQTDIAPTLATMIDRDYNNTGTLGLNIFSAQRQFAVSSYPHYAVCQDSVWKYVWRDNGKESLYKQADKEKVDNYIKVNSEQAQKMKEYLFAMLQYTQYCVSELRIKRQ